MLSAKLIHRSFTISSRFVSGGGSGSKNTSGSAGSIREAGGAFAKIEEARESEYFYKLQKAQFKAMKEQIAREVEHHEQQAKNHAEVVARHKKRIMELENEEKSIIDKK